MNGTFELRNSLVQWSKEPRVAEAWEKIAKREGLDRETFSLASWSFADGVVSLQHQLVFSVNKVSDLHFPPLPNHVCAGRQADR